MRIFKTKSFQKWAKKNKIDDQLLFSSAFEVANGQVEANLGSNLYKKRVASKGRGKSGSTRTIVALEVDGHCFYLFGFNKNEQDNISDNEKKALKLIAKGLFKKTDSDLVAYLNKGILFEVNHE